MHLLSLHKEGTIEIVRRRSEMKPKALLPHFDSAVAKYARCEFTMRNINSWKSKYMFRDKVTTLTGAKGEQ